MSKKAKKQSRKLIARNERADGTTEVYLTGSPTKTVLGKIVIGFLAFAMVAVTVAGLIVVMIQAL